MKNKKIDCKNWYVLTKNVYTGKFEHRTTFNTLEQAESHINYLVNCLYMCKADYKIVSKNK